MNLTQSKLRIKTHLCAALLHQQAHANKAVEINLQQWIEMIRHDLSMLLNTRYLAKPFNPALTAVSHSLYCYGMPDFSMYDPNSAHDREEARKIIQHVIEVHEPRLHNVYVSTLVNLQHQTSYSLNYRIEAEITLLESRLRIALDSSVALNKGNVVIHPYSEVAYAG